MNLRLTRSFEKEFRKVTLGNILLKKKVIKTLTLILNNPNHPSLRLHKLGKDKYWSVSVDKSIRILLIIEKDTISVFHLGKHEDVYR
jgi:mRNA-degrading endonuclease YafQ of YafQ-DinJ toxin-antitoxin module